MNLFFKFGRIEFYIVSNIVYRGWVGILIVEDAKMGSALDARRNGGEILVGLERVAMWTFCCCYIP